MLKPNIRQIYAEVEYSAFLFGLSFDQPQRSPADQQAGHIGKVEHSLQLLHRGARVAVPGQGEGHAAGLGEEVLGVASQHVHHVHPGGGGRLEHIAPDKVMLLVDEILPGVGLVQEVRPANVQAMALTCCSQVLLAFLHPFCYFLFPFIPFNFFVNIGNYIYNKFWLICF